MDRLGVALIGCGRIADLQVLGYLDHPKAELRAVCDRDADLVRCRQAEWGAHQAYTDIDAVLADPNVDVVDIMLPHHLHRAVATAALEAGKHVSLQKPPTLTIGDLEAVARAAGAARRTLRVFGPAFVSWKYAGVPKFGSWEVIAALGMRVRSKYYASDDRLEIHGTEGIIWVNRCTGFLLDEPALVLYRDGETRAFHDVPTDWAESFRRGVHDFIDGLLEGRQPALDATEAAETLRFAIAAHVSATEHREVRLDEIGPETMASLPEPESAP